MSLTETMSPADIAAVTGNNDGMFGNGGWWLIILFLLFGFSGNRFGNNGNVGAADNYVLASDFATLQRQLSDGFGALERKGDGIANGLCDGFYAQNTTMLNGFSGIQNGLNTQGYETRNAITQAQITAMQNANAMQTQVSQCCCDLRSGIADTQRVIDNGFAQTNYNAATNACAINTNVHNAARDITENANANTRAILDALNAQQIAAKDAKIAEQRDTINALNLAASQVAQNNYLVNQLRPAPVPSFSVPNPYAYSGCGCNSCGC